VSERLLYRCAGKRRTNRHGHVVGSYSCLPGGDLVIDLDLYSQTQFPGRSGTISDLGSEVSTQPGTRLPKLTRERQVCQDHGRAAEGSRWICDEFRSAISVRDEASSDPPGYEIPDDRAGSVSELAISLRDPAFENGCGSGGEPGSMRIVAVLPAAE
jgi:hypothetical protein